MQWTVQNENALAYYSVERKGKAGWEIITSIAAVGAVSEKQNSNRDLGLEAGMYAYRIRCVDVDGKYAYTAASNVHVDCDLVNAIQVYPNSANDVVTIEISSSVEGEEDYTITLSDLSGRILSSSAVVVNKLASVRVPVSRLAAGVYTLHIHSNNVSFNRQISVR